MNGIDLNVRDVVGWTVLHHAVHNNYPRCVEILRTLPNVGRNVAQIADWNMTMTGLGDDRATFVMYCLKRNKIEMARCLINTPGLDLDTADRDGKYLETIARDNNLMDMLVLLLISPNRQEKSRLVLRKTNFRCQQYHERQPGQRAVDEACLTEELILRS